MSDKKRALARSGRQLTTRPAPSKVLVGKVVTDELDLSQSISSRFYQIISITPKIKDKTSEAKTVEINAAKACRYNKAHAIFVELVHREISEDLGLEPYDGKLTPAILKNVKTLIAARIVDLYKERNNEIITREFCYDFVEDNGKIFGAANLRQLFNEISLRPDKPIQHERMFNLAEKIVDANPRLRRDLLDCVDRVLTECSKRNPADSKAFLEGDELLVFRASQLLKKLYNALKAESVDSVTDAVAFANIGRNALVQIPLSAAAERPKDKASDQAVQPLASQGTLGLR